MGDTPERKRDPEALQRLANRFHKLAASIPENFWMWDPAEPEPWYSSPAAERIFGRSRKDSQRNPQLMLECIHPEDQPRVLPVMLGRFREPYDLEYRIVRPSGEVRWVRSRSFPTLGDDGELVNLAGITEDVTERKEAEEALAEAERLVSLGRWDVHFREPREFQDTPGRWSDEMYRICGLAPGEIEPTGRRFLELVHPDDRSRAREAMTAAIREGRICDVKHRIVRRDGEVRHVHGRGRLDRLSASPPLFRMVGTLQDVTENERAQRAIEASERKFREVFESSLDAIAIHSAQGGRYLSVNPQYE
ncbi:MAG: PAS domain-containing protein, partial [Deltaproteobacteria bacterium]|nr:PAS domain-containing protein [Deltaproteobacteria bacterium]